MARRKWVEMVEWRVGEEGCHFPWIVREAEGDFVHVVRLVDSILSTRRIGYVSLFGPCSVLVYGLMMMAEHTPSGFEQKESISLFFPH